MNLAYRDVRHGLFRFLLTCFGLGLLLGVVLAMIGIYRGLVVDALTIARAPAADLWVVEANTRAVRRSLAHSRRHARGRRAPRRRGAAGSITYQTVES
jgi:putative ABC transport system permease protein